jgi:hypothetical protein
VEVERREDPTTTAYSRDRGNMSGIDVFHEKGDNRS